MLQLVSCLGPLIPSTHAHPSVYLVHILQPKEGISHDGISDTGVFGPPKYSFGDGLLHLCGEHKGPVYKEALRDTVGSRPEKPQEAVPNVLLPFEGKEG